MTALRFSKLFFDDALVSMILGYTKLYSHGKKEDISWDHIKVQKKENSLPISSMGSGESVAVQLMEYLTTTFSFDIHALFISNAFFKLSLGVAKLFNELILNCCLSVANYILPRQATFCIFVSMSTSRSINYISLWF